MKKSDFALKLQPSLMAEVRKVGHGGVGRDRTDPDPRTRAIGDEDVVAPQFAKPCSDGERRQDHGVVRVVLGLRLEASGFERGLQRPGQHRGPPVLARRLADDLGAGRMLHGVEIHLDEEDDGGGMTKLAGVPGLRAARANITSRSSTRVPSRVEHASDLLRADVVGVEPDAAVSLREEADRVAITRPDIS